LGLPSGQDGTRPQGGQAEARPPQH
jgi:hypothetical protein